jgi:hypothetical protein
MVLMITVCRLFWLMSANQEDSTNAAGAAMVGSSCILQLFLSVLGVLFAVWIFGFLFG